MNDDLGDSTNGRSHRRDADRGRLEQADRMPFRLAGENSHMRRSQMVPHPRRATQTMWEIPGFGCPGSGEKKRVSTPLGTSLIFSLRTPSRSTR